MTRTTASSWASVRSHERVAYGAAALGCAWALAQGYAYILAAHGGRQLAVMCVGAYLAAKVGRRRYPRHGFTTWLALWAAGAFLCTGVEHVLNGWAAAGVGLIWGAFALGLPDRTPYEPPLVVLAPLPAVDPRDHSDVNADEDE